LGWVYNGSMQLEVNPLYGLSYEEIKQKIIRLIQTGELPKSWKDFYAGSTGSALTEPHSLCS